MLSRIMLDAVVDAGAPEVVQPAEVFAAHGVIHAKRHADELEVQPHLG